MIPEIGHFALILALCTAIVQGIFPLIGAQRGIPGWIAVAKPAVRAQLLFLLVAYACLTYGFLTHDFSVLYVASTSNSKLPLIYRISGVWGAHETHHLTVLAGLAVHWWMASRGPMVCRLSRFSKSPRWRSSLWFGEWCIFIFLGRVCCRTATVLLRCLAAVAKR